MPVLCLRSNEVLSEMSAYLAEPQTKAKPQQFVGTLCEHLMGRTSRPALPLSAEARCLGMAPQTFKQRVIDFGVVVKYAAEACFSRFALHLMQAIAEGRLTPLTVIAEVTYDETPLPLRSRCCKGGVQQQHTSSSIVPVTLLTSPIINEKNGMTPGAKARLFGGRLDHVSQGKVVQSDFRIIAVCTDTANDRTVAFESPLPQPLRVVQNCNGRTLADC